MAVLQTFKAIESKIVKHGPLNFKIEKSYQKDYKTTL